MKDIDITTATAARLLGITESCVRIWLRSGHLTKTSGRLRLSSLIGHPKKTTFTARDAQAYLRQFEHH